jgi:Smr domain/Domain of unknown function (DUF2027)
MFKPGDFVRLIHDKEEGRIIRHMSSNEWEIETPDGFRIPVLGSELVKIEKEETGGDDETVLDPAQKRSGRNLAFVNFNDQWWDLYLVNDTMHTILYTLYETPKNNSPKGMAHGILAANQYESIYRISWEQLQHEFQGEIQLCTFEKQPAVIPSTVQLHVRFTGVQLLRSSQLIPLVNKKGYLFSIDQHVAQIPQESSAVHTPQNPVLSVQMQEALSEVDLHIEKLISDTSTMTAAEMLRFQLDTFEKQLDLAIAHGKSDITFIHGLGNGILKQEIHKRLGKNKHVAFFSDARKEKFGYGATLVSLK